MCGCGCNTCETRPAVILNESLVPKEILSEGLKYHLDNNKPLTEHLYRAGSEEYFNLFAEARSLYARNILEFSGDDLHILVETDLGHFSTFEGKKVPLDFPMELIEKEGVPHFTKDGKEWKGKVHKMPDGSLMSGNPHDKDGSGPNGESEKLSHKEDLKEEDTKDTELLKQIRDILISTSKGDNNREDDLETIQSLMGKLDTSIDYVASAITGQDTYNLSYDQNLLGKYASAKSIKEAEYQGEKVDLNKPKRGGSKKFFVYVKDPKTKKIKKVSFGGTTGLKAKINDPEARQNFAKRHNCAEKKDKTKAGYWSCRLPRYSKLLGLKGSYTGFW